MARIRKDLNNCTVYGHDLIFSEKVEVEHNTEFESWQPDFHEEWEGKLIILREGKPTLVDNIDFE